MSLVSLFGLSTKLSLAHFHSLFKSYTESKNPKRLLLIFRELLSYDEKPNDITFALLLKDCSSRLNSFEANQVHTHLIKSGCHAFAHLSTALLDFYAKKSGCLKIALKVFDDMPERDVVSWNALICGFSRNGCRFDALKSFIRMLREGFSPCPATLVGLVPSLGGPDSVSQGMTIHGFGIKTGIDLDSQVKNGFMSMYAKCGNLEATEYLFRELVDNKTVVSWNTMISSFGQNGFSDEAVSVFKQMRRENVGSNPVTMVCLLSANPNPESVHCYTLKTGLDNDFSVVTSLVCEYARIGDSKSAEIVYISFPIKNLVALTAIISSHAERGDMSSATEHFSRMLRSEMKPDAVTMVSIVHGISDPNHFFTGLALHGFGLKTGLSDDNLFANGLISMYSKSDRIESALSVFHEMHEKPLISWNSMISGCVQSGMSSHAFELFSEMKAFGHSPDSITIASLLSGCGQIGYLRFGETLHSHVLKNDIGIENFIATALIDMYAKCGRIERAESIFRAIRDPCLATWNSMISGYSLYGKELEALSSFSEMQKLGLKPDQITFLGVLAACNHGGLVRRGRENFESMRKDFGIAPELRHYACLVGLLGRSGLFDEALAAIREMEIEPDFGLWGCLLSASFVHEEVRIGEYLAKKMFLLDGSSGAFYVLMSNIYAVKERWDDVARVREMMKESGSADGCSGISVIEVTSLEDSL